MAVRIRMKRFGRRHRPYFRICALDSRTQRDGKVIEELGTYDPLIPDVDARVDLKAERVRHWLSVGALPSEKVNALLRKYGPDGTRVEENKAARQRLIASRTRVEPPAADPEVRKPVKRTKKEEAKAAEAEPAEATTPEAAATAEEAPAAEE